MSVEKEDKILFCKDCGEEFIFSIREQDFYAQKGFENDPVRCSSCRATRKRQGGQAVGMGAAHSQEDPTENYYDREATSYASNSYGNGNGNGRPSNYGNNGGGFNNQRPNNYGNNGGGGYNNPRPNNYGNGGGFNNQRPNNYGNQRPNNYGNSYGNSGGGGYNNQRPNNYGNSYGNGGGGYNNQRPNNYGNGGGGGYNNQRPNNYGNSYGNGGGNYGQNNYNQGGYTNQLDRPRYPIVCANCGIKTEVPFVPRDGVPVFCRTCYNNQKPNRN